MPTQTGQSSSPSPPVCVWPCTGARHGCGPTRGRRLPWARGGTALSAGWNPRHCHSPCWRWCLPFRRLAAGDWQVNPCALDRCAAVPSSGPPHVTRRVAASLGGAAPQSWSRPHSCASSRPSPSQRERHPWALVHSPATSTVARLTVPRTPPPPPPISFCGHRGVLHTARVGGRPPRFLDAPSRFWGALSHVFNAAPPDHCRAQPCGRLRRSSAPITVHLLSLSLPLTLPSPQRPISQPSILPRLVGHVAPAPLSRCLRTCVVVPPRRTYGRHHALSRDGGRCPLCPPQHHRPLLWRQPWAVLSTPTPTTAVGAAVWAGRRQLDDPHVRSGACGVPPTRDGRGDIPAAARLRACPAATARVDT